MVELIIEVTQELQSIYGRVFPWQVADLIYCSERTARRYMARLANDDVLVRVGQRKGYYIQ